MKINFKNKRIKIFLLIKLLIRIIYQIKILIKSIIFKDQILKIKNKSTQRILFKTIKLVANNRKMKKIKL